MVVLVSVRMLCAALLALFLASFVSAADQISDQYRSLYQDIQPVGPFTLVDAQGQEFRPEMLHGKVWIVQFFYDSCTEGCRGTTALMKDMQQFFRGKPEVALVSINLDPDNDRARLADIAKGLGAEPGQWHFLTGDADHVYAVVQQCFYKTAMRSGSKDPGKAIAHEFDLMVVDQDGLIRGYIKGTDPENAGPLVRRVQELVRQRFILPMVNASLNAVCAVLLVAGYVAIRRRREKLHRDFMLSALIVSTVFLSCYLYHHIVVMQGRSTTFLGQGWIRPAYYAMLLSHVVLAAVATPLALFVAYLGLRDRRDRHRRLARWTLPVWLYVSITGVLVYWLLYHVYPRV